ncbi:metal-dependent hydrolase [Enterovibrio norvegicus]|uniref:metal-dependent hydrolase n=1 Tax=Enterovibrio norvegicus TaxID=188144 RepID=UPI00352E98CC
MNGVNHVVTSVSGYAIAAHYFSASTPLPEFSIPSAIIVAIGALFPDLDHHQSRLGRLVPFISMPLQAILGHRGAFHSLLALGLIFWFCRDWHSPTLLAFGFGFIGHLVGDMATKSGLSLFWPLGGRVRLPVLVARNQFFEWLTTGCVFIGAILIAT